jgi:hypothetical protein
MTKEFCFDDFALAIHGDAYLIKINTDLRVRDSCHRLTDLPEWIFNSKNAIWLTEEDAPISIRADHGDVVRKRLSEELIRLKQF